MLRIPSEQTGWAAGSREADLALELAIRHRGTRPLRVAWVGSGALLLGAQFWLLGLSPRFAYEGPVLQRPIAELVALGVAAGAIYLALPWMIRATVRPGRALLAWAFAVGLLMRLAMLPSTPILEDDFHRYLWDGAVVARGVNPYAHAPAAALSGNAPPQLVELAQEAGYCMRESIRTMAERVGVEPTRGRCTASRRI